MENKTIFDEFMNMSKEETSNLMKDHFKTMEQNILTKQGKSFKVHNTWGLHATWNDGGKELFFNKILNTLKSTLKEGTDLGRVKRSYIDDSDDVYWFCYETKDNTIRVSVLTGMNINRGTWFTVDEIKIIENNLVESN